MTPQDLENNLAQFTGTTCWYKHLLAKFLYTEGVQYLAEHAGAYWLIDAIASYQPQIAAGKDAMLKEIQFWHLKVNPNKTAVLTCRADSDLPPAISQQIEFTDFPLAEVAVWVQNDGERLTAMLPSEY